MLDKFDAETLGWAELAILDVPLPGKPARKSGQRPAQARLIACMDPEAEQALTDGDLASVDDIWLKPVLVPRIRLRMRNLLSKSSAMPTPPSTCSGWTPDRQHAGSCLVQGIWGRASQGQFRFCEFVGKEA